MARSAASVITNPSVVAMRGWIIPEPLVIPAIRTPFTSANAVLARVSVVRIAVATSLNLDASSDAARSG